jgi:2-aminoadipate transaminase
MTSGPSVPPQLSDLFTTRSMAPSLAGAPASQASATTIRLEDGLADPALFPVQDLARAAEEVLTEQSDVALNYGPPYAQLLGLIVNHLQEQGITADTEHLMTSYGSSQILAVLPDVLIDPGDTVIIEGLSFLGAVQRFQRAGVQMRHQSTV